MKHIKSQLLVIAGLIGANPAAVAQALVSGRISDASGVPIPGAAVLVAGTQSGAVSDTSGQYVLQVPESVASPSLYFSCLGYKSLTVVWDGKPVVDVTLQDDATMLDELVVIGFGSVRKGDLTGSVSSVRIDSENALTALSMDEMLKGGAAGVHVVSDNGAPDAGVSVLVRGAGSLHGSNEPLYVVDGVLLNPSSETGGTLFENAGKETDASNDAVNGLMGLNPADIADIQILKDASATAIYGSLGANGVVLITTRTADKDRPSVSFVAGGGVSTMYRAIDVLDFDEYVDYRVARRLSSLSDFYEDPSTRTGLKVKPVRWQSDATRPAVSQSCSFSITGRPQKLSYLFSLSWKDRTGIVRNTDASQLGIRLNLDRKLGRGFSVGTRTSMSVLSTNSMQSTANSGLGNSSSFMKSIITYRPYMTLNDDEDEDESDDESFYSPYRWLKYTQNRRDEIRITPSVYAQFRILPWLSFKSTLGGDYRDMDRSKFKSSKINRQTTGSVAAVSTTRSFRYNWDNVLMVDKAFARLHSVNGSLGMTLVDSYADYDVTEVWNMDDDEAGVDNISGGANASFRYSEDHSTLLSWFARGVYNYADRYVLTATFRVDGSSKFRGANKWSAFPSLAAAWRVDNEKWFSSGSVSNLKIRAGWGQVGNQAIPAYRTISLMSTSTYADHSGSVGYNIGTSPSYIANPDLKWETTRQWNAGADVSLYDGALSLTADFYDKTTTDLLQKKAISYSSGFSYMWVNDGAIRNRGAEFTLEAVPVKHPLLTWTVGANVSFNRNEILNLGGSTSGSVNLSGLPMDYEQCSYMLGDKAGNNIANYPANIYVTGLPMGLFYGLKTDGIVQEGETGPGWTEGSTVGPGHVRYCDLNGNGYIDVDDRTIIGDPNPDFTYGFNTTLTYRRLRLSASFAGTFGNDVFNVFNISLTNFYSTTNNGNVLSEAVREAWTPENRSETYPALDGMVSNETSWVSDRFIEDASYLRLSKLSLSYDFSFGRKSTVRGLTLTVYGDNLWFLSAYSGWNPEVNSYNGDMLRMGIDAGSYPSARTVGGSVKITF